MLNKLTALSGQIAKVKEEFSQNVQGQMKELVAIINADKGLSKQLEGILSETKYDFVHLDWKPVAFTEEGDYYMLVLTKNSARVVKYASYNNFKEVGIEDMVQHITVDGIIYVTKLFDEAIGKAKQKELKYYL